MGRPGPGRAEEENKRAVWPPKLEELADHLWGLLAIGDHSAGELLRAGDGHVGDQLSTRKRTVSRLSSGAICVQELGKEDGEWVQLRGSGQLAEERPGEHLLPFPTKVTLKPILHKLYHRCQWHPGYILGRSTFSSIDSITSQWRGS